MFSGNSQVKSVSFDLTLQIVLIRYLTNTNIIDVLPAVPESSTESSLSSLVYYYNYITNTVKTTMSDRDYEKAWINVTKVCVWLYLINQHYWYVCRWDQLNKKNSNYAPFRSTWMHTRLLSQLNNKILLKPTCLKWTTRKHGQRSLRYIIWLLCAGSDYPIG